MKHLHKRLLLLVMILTVALSACAADRPPVETPDEPAQMIEEIPVPEPESPEEVPEAEPAEEKEPEVQKPSKFQNLLDEAAFLAAGYDYAGAIEHLQTVKNWKKIPELTDAIASYEQLDSQLVTYPCDTAVPHVFFHSLIADPARAFDKDYTNAGYNQFMTTIDEFHAMLDSLYKKGYVLVSPYDVAYEVTDESGTRFVAGELRLPEGKKPLLMSQDDVNYYGYMIGGKSGVDEIPVFANEKNDGFASKIIIGEDGYPTCLYVDADGNELVGAYDLVPILEEFIQKHPDFSYHGARAMLGITGYEGVLGYRTKPSYQEAMGDAAYEQEVADAKAVADCLKEHGWLLVSHSYGHPAYGTISSERVKQDAQKWEDTVASVIGDTDILIYPHGSDIAGLEHYTMDNAKFKALYRSGYRYFFGVDGLHDWMQMGNTYYRATRRNLDGYRMFYNPDSLKDFFDVKQVFDDARPTPVPPL